MISKKTINAIEVCVYLAGQRHAGYVTTTELSPRLDLSISYLENILKPLKAHNIVGAMKGPGGGYMRRHRVGQQHRVVQRCGHCEGGGRAQRQHDLGRGRDRGQ